MGYSGEVDLPRISLRELTAQQFHTPRVAVGVTPGSAEHIARAIAAALAQVIEVYHRERGLPLEDVLRAAGISNPVDVAFKIEPPRSTRGVVRGDKIMKVITGGEADGLPTAECIARYLPDPHTADDLREAWERCAREQHEAAQP